MKFKAGDKVKYVMLDYTGSDSDTLKGLGVFMGHLENGVWRITDTTQGDDGDPVLGKGLWAFEHELTLWGGPVVEDPPKYGRLMV